VGSFKSAVTKRINQARGTPRSPVWQPNYHDRIIRNAAEHDRIAAYIRDNPAKWLNGTRAC
jgi:REP element-mobilizing transposase RayT